MIVRIRTLLQAIAEAFWLVPGALVVTGILAAAGLIALDRSGAVPKALLQSPWLYNGGSTGARTLLGAVASSAIGVAGTIFSITIAALSLAAGQMGPRLLRNFTQDRGVQVSLGAFLATFAYALMVLRTVRDTAEGAFVPHVALSVALLLALACVATLIYFVQHMCGRINVDTVVELVSADVHASLTRLTADVPQPAWPGTESWAGAASIVESRRGYVQQLDAESLANWAAENGTSVYLAVRLGDYVFPGAPIALLHPDVPGAAQAIADATSMSTRRDASSDLEFTTRRLVEVAVRALSPGINDPMTAISVIDRLGTVLCDLVPRHLFTGVYERDGRVVLLVPSMSYDGLADALFNIIRQNAAGSPAVLIRILDVLIAVLRCESDPSRVATLARHVDMVCADALRTIDSAADRHDVLVRCETFATVRRDGSLACLTNRGSALAKPPVS
jgi:uncharacterized membrane protein